MNGYSVAEGQLTDFQSRIGAVFRHAEYERQLADLRDKLKAGLSEKSAEPKEGEPTVAELDARIKALRADNAVESAPPRIGIRNGARAERPVTARIRAKAPEPQAPVAEVQEPEPEAPQEAVKPTDSDEDETPSGNVVAMPKPVSPAARHTQRVTQRRKGTSGQMSLFD